MREAHPYYQDLLHTFGGVNQYGDPIFRFAWSENETIRISNGAKYDSFRPHQEPCWLLMKWEGPEFYGDRWTWEETNRERSGLFTAGSYPAQGRYRLLRTLTKVKVLDGVLTHVPLDLCTQVVTEILPLLKGFLDLSYEQRAKFLIERQKLEHEMLVKKFGSSRSDYKGSASRKQIQERVDLLERYMGDKAWQRRVTNQTSSRRQN